MEENAIAAKPTFLQRLGLKPIQTNPLPIINQLLKEIAETYFSPFADVYAKEISASPAEKRALKRDLLDMLIQSVGLLAGKPDQALLSLALKIDPELQVKKLEQYISAAKKIFGVPEEKPGEFHPAAKSNSEATRLIALAIQEAALSIPLRFYDGPEAVTKETEESLYNVLLAIEKICRTQQLNDIPALASATGQLYRSIARADDYVWLPLKPLITAPLADRELPLLYARANTDASHLANQIIKSDGVILITGYRGVGKSTFINQVLKNIEDVQDLQIDDVQCKIIPIFMSVAKVATVGGALRLCIRRLYRTFRNMEEQAELKSSEKSYWPFRGKPAQLLTDQEEQHLAFANLRASFRVNMSQAEARSQSRSLQGGMGLNPGDFFVGPVKSAVMAVVPTIGYKTSKDWNEKMDRTISLLDYDEDRAEEDIGQFIDMLTEPRMYNGKKVRVKLLFIFDEMDKMEVKEGQDALIRSLKNLFLRRHAVFLLVTSKEFYYMLLEDRKKEDSMLGSYFSSVIMVPMFTSANTQSLLEKLLDDTSGLSGPEEALLSNLARYFTYRAHGLPREVVREIRSMLSWAPRLVMPYLTDRSVQPRAIQLYALIQDRIENLNSHTETDSGEKENLFMRERIWLSEGRQEQIRRGLYILVEELLNAGSFTVDCNTKFASYDANFSTVAYADFCNVFDQLALRLELIRLPDDLNTGFFERVTSETPTSTEPTERQSDTGTSSKTRRKRRGSTKQDVVKPAAGKQIAIRVLPTFYTLTGRRITSEDPPDMQDAPSDIRPDEVMQQVDELLDQDILFQTRRALNLLSQHPNLPVSNGIQDKLFRLFISSNDLAARIDAGKYLSSDGFYRNVSQAYPQDFLKDETDEAVLKQFVDLTANGASEPDRKNLALSLLRDLLDRNFSRHNPLPLPVFQDALLDIEPLIIDNRKDARDILGQVLKTPELFEANPVSPPTGYVAISPGQFIPPSLVPALMSLAAKAGTNLAMALLYSSSARLDQETLNSVVGSLSSEETLQLWQKANAMRSSPASVSISAAALSRLAVILPKDSDLLQSWLGREGWSDSDKEVLKLADKANPKLFYKLEKNIGKDPASPAYQRLQLNQSRAQVHACKAYQHSYQQARDRVKRARRDLAETMRFIVASLTMVTAIQGVITISRDRLGLSAEILQLAFQAYIAVFLLILLTGTLRLYGSMQRRARAEREVDQARKGIFEFCSSDLWPKMEDED